MIQWRIVGTALALALGACEPSASLAPGVEGCILPQCHGNVEQIHYGGAPLACIDCHGGDPDANTKEAGHPTVTVSFNPSSPGGQAEGGQILRDPPLADLDEVDPVILQFLNPSDYRIARRTCGSATRGGGNCHTRITENSTLSTHATLAGQLAGGLYFGGLTDKEGRFAVRDFQDRYPVDLVGFIESLGQLPGDPSATTPVSPAAEAYYASFGQLCVECHLSRDGSAVPGKYTSSGCNGCHLVTDDEGRPRTADPTQERLEIGHGALHRLTNLIPDSQCNHCHHAHLHRGILIQGVRERSEPEGDAALGGPNRGIEDPENAVYWGDENYVRYEGGYNLYGKPAPFYVADEDGTNDVDETPPDVHFEKGMACIDCHTTGELHGSEHMAVRREFETRVRCESCHGAPGEAPIDPEGSPFEQSLSRTGGNADNSPVISLGEDGELVQRGKLDGGILHPLTQIARRVDPEEERYNPRTQMGCLLHAGSAEARAALAERFAATAPEDVDEQFPGLPEGAMLPADLGSRPGRTECFTCHNAWTVNCYGCHVVRDDRVSGYDQVTGIPQSGAVSTYAMSVVADALALGFGTRGRITPMVGTSIFFSHFDDQGRMVAEAEPLMTVDGFSGDGNQHNPVHHHTIRKVPRDCPGCHPRADGEDDNAEALARATGYGTGRFTFLDGTGRRHILDRLVAIDVDGDGEADDPEAIPLPELVYAVRPLAATTHMAITDEAGELGPGPLDLETINRMLSNPVVPQPRPAQ
ncbi:MAG: hypothetical protein HYY06_07750 [Deltaproteobacteria bacterium]|nr:hypothetical protein [Deltaproteobacteria bacterium]